MGGHQRWWHRSPERVEEEASEQGEADGDGGMAGGPRGRCRGERRHGRVVLPRVVRVALKNVLPPF